MESKRKAVLLLTVCRRYHELLANLRSSRELARAELGYDPDVVLVWARPEVCRLWLLRELTGSGQVTHVVGRAAVPGEAEGRATTHPESLNLRAGLEFIRARYAPDAHYVVGQAADVRPQGGTYAFVDGHMAQGNEAVVFHWANGCVRDHIWHTNFFGVCLDPRYWPPVSTPGDQDVLERQWGSGLQRQALPGVYGWHNSGNRRFVHAHCSEGLPPVEGRAERGLGAATLTLTGHKPCHARLLDWLKYALSGVWLFKR